MIEAMEEYTASLTRHFASMVSEGRGDSARGRNLHTLYFLDFVWSQSRFPLYQYRPSRNPAAFLAMVFDLVGDHLRGYSQHFLEHVMMPPNNGLERDLRARLKAPWSSFIATITDAGLPHLSAVLDDSVKVALRTPLRSTFPAYLRRLRLYMTASQLAHLDVHAMMDALSVAEVFAHMGFVGAQGQQEERHPAGGDLRQAIRKTFDAAWSRVIEKQHERNLITFLASLPVDGVRLYLTHVAPEGDDYGFAVFYARLTDANAPGRLWLPSRSFVGEDEESWQHFAFLAIRDTRDSLSRKVHGLDRLGVSHTFPATVRALDGWLEQEECFLELHAGQPWRETIERMRDRIAQARTLILSAVARELLGVRHD